MKNAIGRNTQALQTTLLALSLMLAIGAAACGDDEDASTDKAPGPRIELIGGANIALSAAVGESVTSALEFGNTGDQALTFELVVDSEWLSATPLEGSVEPGAQQEVALTASCGAQPGERSVIVELRSNDKAHEVYQLAVTLTCTTAAPGSLQISISGLPDGLQGAVNVIGPAGDLGAFEHGATLDALPAGSYTLVGERVEDGSAVYGGPDVEVAVASGAAAQGEFVYELLLGSMDVTITGLADGVEALIRVTGPDGYEVQLTQNTLLSGLASGDYTFSGDTITTELAIYHLSPVNVALSGDEALEVEVPYEPELGRLNVTISGLPEGANADVTISNAAGFSHRLTGSDIVRNLVPGEYDVAVEDVVYEQVFYEGLNTTVVVPSTPMQNLTVEYGIAPGSLDLTVSGLPPGVDAAVAISNADGFSQLLTASELVYLLPGTYTVRGRNVFVGDLYYRPAEAPATVTIESFLNETVSITYEELENPSEVTTEADSGPGSLRDRVATTVSGSTIYFAADVAEIVLTSGHIVLDKDLTIDGPGVDELTISGNETSRIFSISPGSKVTIRGMTLTQGSEQSGGAIQTGGFTHLDECAILDNAATTNGGGIYQYTGTLSITNCHLANNSASSGGALYSEASLDVRSSSFDGNTADNQGGAIYIAADAQADIQTSAITNNTASTGGGAIYTGRAHLTVDRSLFVSNSTTIGVGRAIRSGGTSTVASSTFTLNTTSSSGGAIYNYDGHDLYTSLTIIANTARTGGGVVNFGDAATSTTVGMSIIAENTATSAGPDVYSSRTVTPFISRGYNIIGKNADNLGWTNSSTDLIGNADAPIDPQVLDLADNGGTSETMALAETSPARWAVPEAACLDADDLPLLVDQRGFERPQGGMCSVGAFEPQAGP